MDADSNESTSTSKDFTDQSTQSHVRYGAKALISTSTRILLTKEKHVDSSLFWTLPGGGVDQDESLVDGLRRELFEELQCRSFIDEPVTTIWYAHSSCQNTFSIYTVFECTLLSDPTPNRKEGILEHQWVSPTNLPASTLPQVRYILQENDFF